MKQLASYIVLISLIGNYLPCQAGKDHNRQGEWAYIKYQQEREERFLNEQQLNKIIKTTQNWRCVNRYHAFMYLLLISALSSPALCAEADVSTIKKYIQDHNDGVNATSVEVVSAADVYSSSSSHDNEQASSVAGVNYSSKGGSNKKKHNYNVEPQLSDDEKRQKLRDIIKTRANQELRTADDCLVEIDGEIINLLYVSYQLYQKPEDLNHELIVLDRHRGRSFGMHIFRSLSDKELDKLLNIPTKDGEYVRDIAGQDLIDVFRKRVVAHNPDLKVKKDRERASYALTLKRTRYDAVEKLKMQQELEQLAHEQANAQQKLHIDQNEEII